MIDQDLLADLPPPRDDEPPSLRGDIVDELIDHLQCAFRREVLKDGDEAAAEGRVLDRFGDPKKLARRLWWQAMWSRVMGKKILTGLQWLVSLAAVIIAAIVTRQQAEMLTEMNAMRAQDAARQQSMVQLMAELRQRLPAASNDSTSLWSPGWGAGAGSDETAHLPAAAGGPGAGGGPGATPAHAPALTVKLVQGKEGGPPVTAEINELSLTGAGVTNYGVPQDQSIMAAPAAMGGYPGGFGGGAGPAAGRYAPASSASATGRFLFDRLEPDRYELKITLADGQHCTRPVLIRDDKPQELTIVCPGPRKKVPVLITAPPLPDDLRDVNCELTVQVHNAAVELGGTRWRPARHDLQALLFDPQSGDLVQIKTNGANGPATDLRDAGDNERAVFVLSGPVGYSYEISPRLDGPGSTPVVSWPPHGSRAPAIHKIQPAETHWKLELPEEFLAEARKELIGEESGSSYFPAAAAPAAAAPEPAGDRSSLTVNLVEEIAGGPSAKNAKLTLVGAGKDPLTGQARNFQLSRNATGGYQSGPLDEDRYELYVDLEDHQRCVKPVLIRANETRTLQIITPPLHRKIAIRMQAALPADLQLAGLQLTLKVAEQPYRFEGNSWTYHDGTSYSVEFDPETGKPLPLNGQDASPESPVEPDLLLPTGSIGMRYILAGLRPASPGTPASELRIAWPADHEPLLSRAVKPGENRWKLELPEELLAAARKQLSERKSK